MYNYNTSLGIYPTCFVASVTLLPTRNQIFAYNHNITTMSKFILNNLFIVYHKTALVHYFIYMFAFTGGLELFMGFLKSEFSEENLEFWIACEELRLASESKIPVMAQNIYTEYVGFNAPKEVS